MTKLNTLEVEMLAALNAVLHAYKDYGARARRDSEEYMSLTAARRAIRHATAAATCGKSYVFTGGASGGDISVPCVLAPNHKGSCKP